MDRRRFLGTTASIAAAFQATSVARAQDAIATVAGRPADTVARDEDFWFNIRHAFTVDRNMINLNNGGVAPAPKIVMDTEVRYLEMENLSPSYYMWNVLDPGVETVRRPWPACSARTRKRSPSRAMPAKRMKLSSWACT